MLKKEKPKIITKSESTELNGAYEYWICSECSDIIQYVQCMYTHLFIYSNISIHYYYYYCDSLTSVNVVINSIRKENACRSTTVDYLPWCNCQHCRFQIDSQLMNIFIYIRRIGICTHRYVYDLNSFKRRAVHANSLQSIKWFE